MCAKHELRVDQFYMLFCIKNYLMHNNICCYENFYLYDSVFIYRIIINILVHALLCIKQKINGGAKTKEK